MSNIDKVESIISFKDKEPTILNTSSNFVIVTYWWGRNNYNSNTARPCLSFYEQFIKKARNIVVSLVKTLINNESDINTNELSELIEHTLDLLRKTNTYNNLLLDTAGAYINSLYLYFKIKKTENSANTLMDAINTYKNKGKISSKFKYKTKKEIADFLHKIIKQLILLNTNNIIHITKLDNEVVYLKEQYQELLNNNVNSKKLNKIKQQMNTIIIHKNNIKKEINASLKKPTKLSLFPEYTTNISILNILNNEMQYQPPIKFEEMIDNWENVCKSVNCNYLAIEYPEFAQPGGYQLAINAKPFFIKKALQLCNKRAVVYIDGDMIVRKYPLLFDIDNVDFMARGWWIDPRGGSNFINSIVFDPYMFETSGGIMYFSQSDNSKYLIQKWIDVAGMKSQRGKADDRVLSLVFNSYKCLLNMKIIQLPIEYLWLTLRYNDFLLENIYNYNETAMNDSIIIEHPECLTSEETATGEGADSDRTPKYYNFIGEEHILPISEELHEYLMFPNEKMVSAFKDYFKFMKSTVYINDGSEYLINSGFVNPNDSDLNESPLYIIPYNQQLGNKKSLEEDLTYNEISKINIKRAYSIKPHDIPIVKYLKNKVVVINDNDEYLIKDNEIISLILNLITYGNTVIYNPIKDEDYDKRYYNKLMDNLDRLYKDTELGFVPIIKESNFSNFFKPEINTSQVMLFRGNNRILSLFLSRFLSLSAFSNAIKNGAYQLISRVSIAYINKSKKYVTPDVSAIELITSVDSVDKTDKTNKTNKTNKTDKTDKTNKTNITIKSQSGIPIGRIKKTAKKHNTHNKTRKNNKLIGGNNANIENKLQEHEYVLNDYFRTFFRYAD